MVLSYQQWADGIFHQLEIHERHIGFPLRPTPTPGSKCQACGFPQPCPTLQIFEDTR